MALLAEQAVEAAPPTALHAIQAAARLAAQSAIPPSLALQLLAFMAQIKLKTAGQIQYSSRISASSQDFFRASSRRNSLSLNHAKMTGVTIKM
jgi:Tfp pilus assembly PilM family ATPase